MHDTLNDAYSYNEANGRIPTRPLSYKYVDLAFNRELILDYENGILYMKDDNGVVHCITDQIIDNVIFNIVNDPDFSNKISILYKGKRYPLNDFIDKIIGGQIDKIKELLGWEQEVDKNGEPLVDENGYPINVVLKRIDDIENRYLKLSGGIMSGSIEMSDNSITGLKNATNATDATNLSDVKREIEEYIAYYLNKTY